MNELSSDQDLIYILVSGGSSSNFLLNAFAKWGDKKKINPIYFQFVDFQWLERESLFSQVKNLNLNLKIINFNELDFAKKTENWTTHTINERYRSIYSEILSTLEKKAISGHGVVNVYRDNHGKLNKASDENLLNIDSEVFFNSEINSAILNCDKGKLFFELGESIPFQDFRYWQDFVFKDLFSNIEPCTKWEWHDVMRIFRW